MIANIQNNLLVGLFLCLYFNPVLNSKIAYLYFVTPFSRFTFAENVHLHIHQAATVIEVLPPVELSHPEDLQYQLRVQVGMHRNLALIYASTFILHHYSI
jgi:hypothetical protein